MIFDRFISKYFIHAAFEICYFCLFILFVNYGEDRSSADHVNHAGANPGVVSQGAKTPAKPNARHLCFG
jgi:hypothetical protein